MLDEDENQSRIRPAIIHYLSRRPHDVFSGHAHRNHKINMACAMLVVDELKLI
jgi:hypothetical protein